jgi:hypothetical protein
LKLGYIVRQTMHRYRETDIMILFYANNTFAVERALI